MLLRTAALLLLLLVTAPQPGGSQGPVPSLVARRITQATAASDLFTGSVATGGINDWYLSNGVVEAIVDDVGFQVDRYLATGESLPIQSGNAQTGGSLIDLGLFGQGNDQLSSVFPLVLNVDVARSVFYVPASFALGDPTLPHVIADVDVAADEASLTVYGYVLVGPSAQSLQVETRYSVRSGESFLRLRSTLTNTGATVLPVKTFADVILLGNGGLLSFLPYPGRGFNLELPSRPTFFQTVFGRLRPEDGSADPDSLESAGEVSYTFFSEDGLLYAAGDGAAATAGRLPSGTDFQPGATYTFSRRIFVGGRNDVAASADQAFAEVSSRFGLPMGRVRGQLSSPDGNPFRASIEVIETDVVPATPEPETILSSIIGDTSPMPVNHVVTDAGRGGLFEASVPAGAHELRIQVEERDPIGPIAFEVIADQVTDVGVISLSDTGTLVFAISDFDSGLTLPARITLKGLDVPDPQLGEPLDLTVGGVPLQLGRKYTTPYRNLIFTGPGRDEVSLRPGRYRVIASHGHEYDMAWVDADVLPGARTDVPLALRRAVDTTGWLAADFHIHAAPSLDSSVPLEERVRSYAAEGIDVMVSADHDFVTDYDAVIASLGLADQIVAMAGCEVTTTRAFGSFASGVGHINGWPLAVQPDARKNGAPEDEQNEPSVIYDRLRSRGAAVVQQNHPLSPNQGFLSAFGFDPALPVDIAPNDVLLQSSALGTGTTNLDFDAIEIYNGQYQTQFEAVRDAWFSLLNQGIVKTATASSDSHDIGPGGPGLGPGTPRTYVAHPDADLTAFDAASFNDSLRSGAAFGSSGPILRAEAEWNGAQAGPGELLSGTGCCISLHVQVEAPCWMPVGEVQIYANGVLETTLPVAPGCSGALRFDDMLPVAPAADTHYVVMVRELVPRPAPNGFEQQLGRIVYPTTQFQAFSNAIFVDVDGNGRFDAPGLAPAPIASARASALPRVGGSSPLSDPPTPSRAMLTSAASSISLRRVVDHPQRS